MIRIPRLVAAIFIVFVALSLADRVTADCKQPELESFLEDSRAILNDQGAYFPVPQARRLPFEIDGRTLQWFGVGWEGPKSGALFVLDCEGRRLAAMPLGYVSELRNGATLPGVGPTVQVVYSPGEATNYKIERVAIFAFHANTLESLWNHTVFEGAFILPNDDGVEKEYTWRVSADGKDIRVDGLQRVFAKPKRPGDNWGRPAIHELPTEAYCWNGATFRYVTCPHSR